MPLYEYRCKSCDHWFEKIQAFGEEPLTTCPECEDGVLVRVISPPGFIIKKVKPSGERRTQRVGNRDIPIHQTEDDGHWEQNGIMDRR